MELFESKLCGGRLSESVGDSSSGFVHVQFPCSLESNLGPLILELREDVLICMYQNHQLVQLLVVLNFALHEYYQCFESLNFFD